MFGHRKARMTKTPVNSGDCVPQVILLTVGLVDNNVLEKRLFSWKAPNSNLGLQSVSVLVHTYEMDTSHFV